MNSLSAKAEFIDMALNAISFLVGEGGRDWRPCKGHYDKQNLTLVIISYEMITSIRSSLRTFDRLMNFY